MNHPGTVTVARSGLWIGVVERGEMLREVQGSGKLVPEPIQVAEAHGDALTLADRQDGRRRCAARLRL